MELSKDKVMPITGKSTTLRLGRGFLSAETVEFTRKKG